MFRLLIKSNSWSINEGSCSIGKKYFSPLGITAAASAINARIRKKIPGSGTTLTISNEEMKDIMKIVQALVDLNILLKGVTKTIKMKQKNKKKVFLVCYYAL